MFFVVSRVRGRYPGWESVWASLIAKLQTDGRADPGLDPVETAWMAIGLLDGLSRLHSTHPDIPVNDLLAAGLGRLLAGGRP